jgi:hypothetical protein
MSLGGGQSENAYAKARLDHLMAKADADRAAREAGRTSLFARLLVRLRPRRQAPHSGQQSATSGFDDPGL